MKEEFKYCWLDMSNGKFSNTWDEETHKEVVDKAVIEHGIKRNWKLIKFQCLTDNEFEFMNKMKLR